MLLLNVLFLLDEKIAYDLNGPMRQSAEANVDGTNPFRPLRFFIEINKRISRLYNHALIF